MNVFFLLLLFLLPLLGFSQTKECPKTRNRQANQYYEKALQQQKNQREAIDLFQKALELAPNFYEAYYALGEMNYQKVVELQKNPLYEGQTSKFDEYNKNVEYYFSKSTEFCPQYKDYMAYFYLGELNYNKKKYESAEKNLKQFMNNSQQNKEILAKTVTYLNNTKKYFDILNHPVPFEPKSVFGVCSEEDEFLPVLSPDGEYMYYTFRPKEVRTNRPSELFVYSTRQNRASFILRDTFSSRVIMSSPFNEGKNQGGASFTIDNNHMYITICEYIRMGSTSYKNCDIYTSDYEGDTWTPLRKMSSAINNDFSFEGQPSVTADGNVLFFASAREESIGKMDLFFSVKKSDGKWSKAKNLGKIINTPDDEKTPFIHSDSRTLYFASDGHIGMGGLDVFYSKFEPNNPLDSFYTDYQNGHWTEPVNIGYPINTKDDEFGFVVGADGTKIYFSSNTLKGDGGGIDIFSANLHEKARPKKVLFLKGKVTDDSGKPLKNATVELTSLRTHEMTNGIMDKNTGKYAVAVPVKKGEDFIITAKRQGKIYASQYVNPNVSEFQTPTEINLGVKTIKKGASVVLDDVHFATDSYQLNSISKALLNNLVDFLKENPNIHIEIQGHTDNIGDDASNLILSNNRAKAVRDYLVLKGINAKRLVYKGFGETKPVGNNETEQGRAKNRRTEFIIQKL